MIDAIPPHTKAKRRKKGSKEKEAYTIDSYIKGVGLKK
jgi:hypothetical protein